MRWVIKVGSGVLAAADGTLQKSNLERIARSVVQLRRDGHEVIVVSSGAVASGFRHLGYDEPPKALPERQACASIGQFFLISAYERVFSDGGFPAGVVLLTHDDFRERRRYVNARNTLEALLRCGAIPVINENDAVAVEEILMGDNDQLASLVAVLVHADVLVLLTNVDGVYDGDPEAGSTGLVKEISDPDAWRDRVGAGVSRLGSGGMRSKLEAAARAASFGIRTIVASGLKDDVIPEIASGGNPGTAISAGGRSINARKFWIRFVSDPKGIVVIDEGAVKALQDKQGSLLPIGVRSVQGEFNVGDTVRIVNASGDTIGHGLCEYNDEELRRIAGANTREIESILGYRRTDVVIHRDDMALGAVPKRERVS